MESEWAKHSIADKFDRYNNVLERALGYTTAYRLLRFEDEGYSVTLDYGCGAGKVSNTLARLSNKSVIGVDSSPRMIELAQNNRAHPLIDYRVVSSAGDLSFIAAESVDGAISCYVFGNISSDSLIDAIFQQVSRVLKSNAPFVVLLTNPSSTGVQFSTFRVGAPGRTYGRGEPIAAALRVPGDEDDLLLNGFYWPKSMYLDLLDRHGFTDVQICEPTLEDLSPEVLREFEESSGFTAWEAERSKSPFVLFRGLKRS